MGTAGQNIGLELPKVCRRRDEAPNPQGAEPIAIRGATPASNEKQTRKPLKPRTFDEPQLHNAGRRCGRSNRYGRQPSQPNAGSISSVTRLNWRFWSYPVTRSRIVVAPASTYLCRLSMHCIGEPAATQSRSMSWR